MERRRMRPAAAGLLVAAIAGSVGGGSHASAGAGLSGSDMVDVELTVRGPDAQAVLDALTFEIYDDGGVLVDPLTCGTALPDLSTPSLTARETFNCTPGGYGTFRVGLAGAPADWLVNAFCTTGDAIPAEAIEAGTPTFTLEPFRTSASCLVQVLTPVLAIDKVVEGGEATVADFAFEVYDDTGAQVDTGDLVDPSADLCTSELTECELVALPPDAYTLGEAVPGYGYEVTSVVCDSYVNLENEFDVSDELIELDGADFFTDDGDAYCTVTNTYREGQLIVSASVTNDEGGTATTEDISIEVFRSPSGDPVIAATACAADGTCLDEMLPIGDYVIGYTGPDGYAREITQSVSAVLELVTDDPDAEFTSAFGQTVEIAVVIDDPAPPATTTTTVTPTTTAAPTTTVAPTIVTTSSIDAAAITLPQTGTGSTNAAMATIAALLVGIGGALLAVRRRTA